jgi:hypothetical protein
MSETDFSGLDLAQIRAQRSEAQMQEDAVSFVRRMAQGRLDIARDDLAQVFGQEHGGGSARPPRETNVSPDHQLVLQLEALCVDNGFGSLRTLDEASLQHAINELEVFEQACSAERRALFATIDALTAELVKRLKDNGANVDAMLNDK